MHLIQKDQIKCLFLTTGQTRHCGSVPYLQGRGTLSASLLNSSQSGTFHYLSTFLHIHWIGLHCGRGKGSLHQRRSPGWGQMVKKERGKKEVERILVRENKINKKRWEKFKKNSSRERKSFNSNEMTGSRGNIIRFDRNIELIGKEITIKIIYFINSQARIEIRKV